MKFIAIKRNTRYIVFTRKRPYSISGMTKKIRLVLFITITIIFFAVTPTVVLYVQGYRFDFNAFSFLQTGSLYLDTKPKKALIFLNEKRVKTQTPALITRLLPQKLNIKVEKDGFYSWEKRINIEPGLVAEAKNIILMPTEINRTEILSSVDKIYPSPRNNYFLAINQNQLSLMNEKISHVISIDSYFKNPLEAEKITDAIKQNNIAWHKNEKKIIAYDQQTNYLIDFQNGTIKQFFIKNTELDSNKIIEGFITAKKIEWHPFANNTILFIHNKNIYSYNMESKNSETVINQAVDFRVIAGTITSYLYYIDHAGFLNRHNFITKSGEQISATPIIYREPSEIIISYDQKKAAILEKATDKLFLINENSVRSINNVKFAAFAGDSKKIVYGNGNEVLVLYLENTNDHLKKTKDTIEKIANSDNGNITNASWYEKTNQHLWVSADELYFSELDSRPPRNTYTALKINSSNIFINNDKIYYMENDNFYFANIAR